MFGPYSVVLRGHVWLFSSRDHKHVELEHQGRVSCIQGQSLTLTVSLPFLWLEFEMGDEFLPPTLPAALHCDYDGARLCAEKKPVTGTGDS